MSLDAVPHEITRALIGYRFESKFHQACLQARSFSISYGNNSAGLTLNTCVNMLKGERKFTKDFLCRLYDKHPAIDFVGEFEVKGASCLVMFQLSVSGYTNHRRKVGHLNKTYQNYTEFKNTTVLNYYKSLCNETENEVIFI